MNDLDPRLIHEIGITAFVICGMFTLIWWLFKCSFRIKEEILKDAKEERGTFLSIINSFQRSIDEANKNATEGLKQSDAYIEHARTEHQKIIEIATETCKNSAEFRKESAERAEAFRRDHEKMIANLDEQAKVLLRINGEKHG